MFKIQKYKVLFSNKKFLRLWVASLISVLGDGISRIALVILVTDYFNSEYALSLVMMVGIIPNFILGPIAGIFIDVNDKKWIMIGADCLRAITVLIMVLNLQHLIIICVCTVFSTIGSILSGPARSVLLPSVIRDEDLNTAISFERATGEIINMIGPSLGGVLIATVGIKFAFLLDGLTFAFSAIIIGLTSFSIIKIQSENTVKGIIKSIKEGFHFINNGKLRFIVILLSIFAFFAGLYNVLHLDYIRKVINIQPFYFGLLMSISSGIMLLTSFLYGMFEGSHWKVPYYSLFGFAFAALIYFLNPNLIAIFFITCLVSSFEVLFSISAKDIFIKNTNENIRGRVFATTNSLLSGVQLVGVSLSSVMLSFFPTAIAVGITGVFLLGIIIWVWTSSKRFLSNTSLSRQF